MSKEESINVNGALVAAQILDRLPNQVREQLVESIREINPGSALKIESILITKEATASNTPPPPPISAITHLPNIEVQKLLREVAPHDLAISLKTAPIEAQEKILDNLSETRQHQLIEEFNDLPPMHPNDITAAQNRVMKKLEDIYSEDAPTPTPRRLRSRLA